MASCCGCGGFRFDSNRNHCYTHVRTFVFFLYTIFWIAFVVVLQASITSTFDYLLSGGSRVIAEWVVLAAVFVMAVFFTYIYLRFESPLAEYIHARQRNAEHQLAEFAHDKQQQAEALVTQGVSYALDLAFHPKHEDKSKTSAAPSTKEGDRPAKSQSKTRKSSDLNAIRTLW
jgi:hypothetical protein